MSDVLTFRSLAHEPSHPKSSLMKLYESFSGRPAALVHSAGYAHAGMHLLRSEAESAAMGLIMGAVQQANGGLDFKGKYPIDGIGSVLLSLASLAMANHPDGLSVDARTVAGNLTYSYCFRQYAKLKGLVTKTPAVHGEGEDPIVAAMAGLED